MGAGRRQSTDGRVFSRHCHHLRDGALVLTAVGRGRRSDELSMKLPEDLRRAGASMVS
jgi:hypothetical protein